MCFAPRPGAAQIRQLQIGTRFSATRTWSPTTGNSRGRGLTSGCILVNWCDVLCTSPRCRPNPPASDRNTVLGDTNLVAYDWELTGPRIDQWLHFGQLVRCALHLAQVPPKSASFRSEHGSRRHEPGRLRLGTHGAAD